MTLVAVTSPLAMSKAAAARGTSLKINSAYRSAAYQSQLYWSYVARDGRAVADTYSARPGHSEHQTGLAVDLAAPGGRCYLQRCFGDTPSGRWVARRAHVFGFVMSYPRGRRRDSGFAYEPWHFRYVGPQVAGRMRELGIQLLPDYLRAPYASAGLGLTIGG